MILYLLTRFHCHTFFPFQDIKQNVLFSSYLDNWWHHELQDLSSIILYSNGLQVEKEGRTEIRKIEYFEKEKSFFDEIKSIFHRFWRPIVWWKNKNLMKIADKSFKYIKLPQYFFCWQKRNLSQQLPIVTVNFERCSYLKCWYIKGKIIYQFTDFEVYLHLYRWHKWGYQVYLFYQHFTT